ncbi:MAG: hypothetical protein GY940_37925 [bacterium]|nr:hypothetical protein [bacterium]
MERVKEYVTICWHCSAAYDAFDANFCNHNDPTVICPFCLSCFCDAPREIKDAFIKNSPKELLEEKVKSEEGGNRKLGELLIKAGKINQGQLDHAIQQQGVMKQQLGEIFITMGLVTKEELSVFLMDQKEIDEINLEGLKPDFVLVKRVGPQLCLNYQFIPLELLESNKEKVLRFAVPSRVTLRHIKLSGKLSGYVLIPYLADQEQINRLLGKIRTIDMIVMT